MCPSSCTVTPQLAAPAGRRLQAAQATNTSRPTQQQQAPTLGTTSGHCATPQPAAPPGGWLPTALSTHTRRRTQRWQASTGGTVSSHRALSEMPTPGSRWMAPPQSTHNCGPPRQQKASRKVVHHQRPRHTTACGTRLQVAVTSPVHHHPPSATPAVDGTPG